MKIMSRLSALIMATMMTIPTMAAEKATVKVTPVSQDADAANGGMIYALPKTVAQIRLTAQVVVSSVGPYYQYSTRFLNLTDVVTENSMKWKLIGAEITTTGQVDYSRRFKISTTDDGQMPQIALTPDGTIAAINTPMPAAAQTAAAKATPEIKYADFSDVPLSQSILARTSKAAMAEECAQTIYSLRAARVGIVTGAAEHRLPDSGSMAQALAEIDRLEKQHVELFAGRRDTIVVTQIVEVIPDYDGPSNIVPARFSETAGFVDAMDLSGKPVYVDLEFDDSARVNDGATSKQKQSDQQTGFRYMIPGNVTIKVMDRNVLLTQKKIRCTQNGQIATIPASQILTNALTFDPATGAIVSIGKADK